MPFGPEKRGEIKERSGYYCQICGAWHQPHKDDVASRLEAHSMDRTHEDGGLAVCSHRLNNCHQRLHDITDDSEELKKIGVTAVNLNNLSLAWELQRRGLPENKIKRVLTRVGSI